jgi:hypothetical protein
MRKIWIFWILTWALGLLVTASPYYMISQIVAHDAEAMRALRSGFAQRGINDPVTFLTPIFFLAAILVFVLSHLGRWLVLHFGMNRSSGKLNSFDLSRILSRYNLAVTVSQLISFLIPIAGIAYYMLTGGDQKALVIIAGLWVVTAISLVPRMSEIEKVTTRRSVKPSAAVSTGGSALPEQAVRVSCSGTNIGNMNCPGGELIIEPDRLTVRTLLGLMGEYDFSPQEVVAIDAAPSKWWTDNQIRIRHTVRDYPRKVTFQSAIDSKALLSEIASNGFEPQASPADLPKDDGLPFRWLPIIVLVIIWNILILLGIQFRSIFLPLALLMVFSVSTLIWKSHLLRTLFLKTGRQPGQIRPFLAFLSFISGFLLLVGLAQLVGGLL